MKLIDKYSSRFISFIFVLCFSSAVYFSIPSVASEGLTERPVIKDPQRDTFFSLELELDRLNSLIAQDGSNADYFYNRGWIFEQMDDPVMAEKDYSTAIEINSEHSDALYNRGLINLKGGKYDLAIKDFSEVIRINPGSADAFCNRGNAYLAKKKTKKALQDFTSAIGLTPQDPDLYYNRALIYMSRGKKTKAMEDMRKAAGLGHLQAREYLNGSGNRL